MAGRYRLAFIGSWEAAAALRAIGADALFVSRPEDALEAWESLPKDDYAVVVITEPAYLEIKGKVGGFPPAEGLPVVLVVPEVGGKKMHVGAEEIRDIVMRTVGSMAG